MPCGPRRLDARQGTDIEQPTDDFATAFEGAFARLQVRVEEAMAGEGEWPVRIAAAIRAGLDFAAADPAAANLLSNEALSRGAAGIARYQRLIGYLAGLIAPGRECAAGGARLPEITERALAGGVAMLVAKRLDQGRAAELPSLAPEAIEFVLTPYVGNAEARRIAAA